MRKGLWRQLGYGITVITTAGALFGIWVDYIKSIHAEGTVGVALIGIMAILGYINVGGYEKKVHYSEVFEQLNLGFKQLYSLERELSKVTAKVAEKAEVDPKPEKIDKDTFLDHFEEVCTSFIAAFEKAKFHRCAISIKMLSDNGTVDQFSVANIVRDAHSNEYRDKSWKAYLVNENTPYKLILTRSKEQEGHLYFHSNNLPRFKGYENSRLLIKQKEWEQSGKIKSFIKKKILRNRYWPLEYKSTIVVPIIPYKPKQTDFGNKIVGFLCIDSPHKSVFNEKTDVEIMKGMADALYNKIILFLLSK